MSISALSTHLGGHRRGRRHCLRRLPGMTAPWHAVFLPCVRLRLHVSFSCHRALSSGGIARVSRPSGEHGKRPRPSAVFDGPPCEGGEGLQGVRIGITAPDRGGYQNVRSFLFTPPGESRLLLCGGKILTISSPLGHRRLPRANGPARRGFLGLWPHRPVSDNKERMVTDFYR